MQKYAEMALMANLQNFHVLKISCSTVNIFREMEFSLCTKYDKNAMQIPTFWPNSGIWWATLLCLL